MEDKRWTLKDKLEQFRDVTALYNSTNENIKGKISQQRKKQSNEIKNLTAENKKFRQQYDEALHNDKKRLLPVLGGHPTMQLAMNKLNNQQIEEELKQSIFCKTKELDRLRYKRKSLEDTLFNKKLESGKLQHETEDTQENHIWEQELANQLQSVNVKLNRAYANRAVYEKALNILQKDAIRFDEVLRELRKDLEQQSESILHAIEMGQQATEELGSLQKEYRTTERRVRTNMKQRDHSIRALRAEIDGIRQQAQSIQQEFSQNLPHQSQFDLHSEIDVVTNVLDDAQVKQEISIMLGMLDEIKQVAMVQHIEEICPRIEEQKKQKAWLLSQVEKNNAQLAKMLELCNQLDVMLEVAIYHTMTEEAIKLRDDRHQLHDEIEEEKEKLQEQQEEMKSIGEKIVYVRTALLTLNMLVDTVMPGDDLGFNTDSQGHMTNLSQPNTDALTLMEQVTRKVKWLLEEITDKEPVKANVLTEFSMLSQPGIQDDAENMVADMLEDLEDMDDPSVLTRKAVKAESKRLVDMHNDPRALFQDTSGVKYKKHKCF